MTTVIKCEALMDELETSREMYYAELDRTEKINSRINANIVILTAAASGEIFIWSKIEHLSGLFLMIYIIMCVMSTIFFAVCIKKFVGAYNTNFDLRYYPIRKMAEVQKWTYDMARDNKITLEEAEEHIINMNIERYTNDAIMNQRYNESKVDKYNDLIMWFVVLAFSVMITAIMGIVMINISNKVGAEGFKGFLFLIF